MAVLRTKAATGMASCVTVVLVALAAASIAGARRNPTRGESAAISAALHKPNSGIRRGL